MSEPTGPAPTPVQPNLTGGNLFTTSAAAASNNNPYNALAANWSTNSLNPDLNNTMPTIVVTPSGGAQVTPTTGPVVSTPTIPQVNPGQTNNTTSNSTSVPQPSTVPTSSLPSTSSISQQLAGVVQPNPLNNFYQPAYHFRLFTAKDTDILVQSGNSISGISRVPQVTIVETGVTGYNISEVEITTVGAGTDSSVLSMTGTYIKMTVVEPLGLSFLDALVGAQAVLQNNDPSKMPYYLELTFTGYNTNGSYAGRPLNVLSGLANGGKWIWSIIITNIATKLNEGSATYNLECVIIGSQMLTDDTKNANNPQKLPQTITVSGNTVGAMYNDLVTKLNNAWVYLQGGQKKTPLVKYLSIRTNPITTGPSWALQKDPANFVLTPNEPDKSSSRVWALNNGENGTGLVTCQIPAGTTVSDFLRSAINASVEGQKFIKDAAAAGTTTPTNTPGFREVMTFMINPYISYTSYDTDHNNYIRSIQMDVVPHYTLEPILDIDQIKNAQVPANQTAMVQSIITKGFIKKRYDYIFTGLNTEVIDMDLSWNMAWQGILPRLAGAAQNYTTEALQGLLNTGSYPVSRDGTRQQAGDYLRVQPDTTAASPSTQYFTNLLTTNPGGLNFTPPGSSTLPNLVNPGPNSNTVAGSVQATLQQNQTNAVLAQMAANQQTINAAAAPTPTVANPVTTPPANPSGQVITSNTTNLKPGNTYIEDVTSAINNQTQSLPIAIWSGFLNVQNKGSTGFNESYYRDQHVADAVFTQMMGNPLDTDGKFRQMKMTIRGDPFWLGQTDLDREINLINKKYYDPSPSALPDYQSGNQYIYVHFKYPLQIGDNFVPILKDSIVFNGFYFVTGVTHKFSGGVFTQELECVMQSLLSPSVLNSSSSASTATTSGAGSNTGLGQGNTTPATGITPGTSSSGPSLTPTTNGLGQVTPTAIQSSDPTAVGNLTSDQTAGLKAAIGEQESGNNPSQGNNGLGYIGQYQFGQSALQDTGYVSSGGIASDPSSWNWTGQNGINSVSDFLNSPTEQNTAMNGLLQQNFNTLSNNGTITSNTSAQTTAGLLGAAQLAGAGGATNFANGNGNPSDAFGSSTQKFYNIGYNSISPNG